MQDQNHGIKKPLCAACCVVSWVLAWEIWGLGTSDFMKFLRSHLHPAALKSHPAWGVEAAGRNQETTNNTKRLGDASVLGILMLGTPPIPPTTKENG